MEPLTTEPPRSIDSSGTQLSVLLGLTGFAVSQPLLSLAGANPTLFVFNGVGRVSMVVGALLIALALPLALWSVVRAVHRLRADTGRACFLGLCTPLLVLAGLQWGRDLGLGPTAYAMGLAVAAAGTIAIIRVDVVIDWLRYTAVLPFVALGLFLFASDSSDLLRSATAVERNDIVGVEPSVVFLILDELPTLTLLGDDGSIDGDAFPNFRRLADDATWYRNFTTMSATTETAVPALLSGSTPRATAPLWTRYPDSVFTLLAPTHGLTVRESFTQICGLATCSTAGPDEEERSSDDLGAATDQLLDLWFDRLRGRSASAGLDDFEEAVADGPPSGSEEQGGIGFFPDDETVRRGPTRLTDFVDSMVPSADPHLYFLHLVLPHIPFRWFPDGTQYASEPDPLTIGALLREVEWIARLDEQRHLLQAQYTDRLLGLVLDRLESQGMYEETVVVVAVDHGLAFEVGEGRRSMDGAGRSSTAFVPLLAKEAGQTRGRVDDQNLMTPDVLPLIADLVGVEVPFETDGAAPDSEQIAARGAEKVYFPVRGDVTDAELDDPATFDGAAEAPDPDDRRLDPAGPGEAQLAPLLSRLGSRDAIGAPLDDIVTVDGASARVFSLDEVTSQADAGEAVMAFVQGAILSGPTDGEVLVAVDGTVVSGSAIFETNNGHGFIAMLPSDIAGSGFDLRLAIAADDGRVIEVAIEGA